MEKGKKIQTDFLVIPIRGHGDNGFLRYHCPDRYNVPSQNSIGRKKISLRGRTSDIMKHKNEEFVSCYSWQSIS